MPIAQDRLRLLLVEDDYDVAAGLAAYLEPRGMAPTFAYNRAQALQAARSAAFDLIVMDVQLPDGDGVELCRDLKSGGLRTPILFLTACGALPDKLRGFEAGGIDYMVKPFAPAELAARIQALVLATAETPRSLTLRVGAYALDTAAATIGNGVRHLLLSATQLRILRALFEAAPGSVSRADLIDRLWEGEVPASDPLRMHIYDLRRQFECNFGRRLIATIRGLGYRFDVTR